MKKLVHKLLPIVANTLLIGSVAWAGFAVWQSRQVSLPARAPKAPLALSQGSPAPVIKGINYSSHDHSVVVFVSTTCHYCESSTPFYNKLHVLSRDSSQALSFHAVYWESEDTVRASKAKLNLIADTLSGIQFQEFGVHSTPTALLVDRKGMITKTWVGSSETVERDISSHVSLLQ